MEAGVEQFSADTWVEVPALALALEGFRPNPAVGAPRIAFTLPDVGPARLEVFDVVGREVFSRDLGSLPAGPQRLTLDGTTLSPGIYVTRLTRGGRTLSARGVVTR
jgi:serine protease AprX